MCELSFANAAALRLEGEQYAAAFLEHLMAGTETPDELALLTAFLDGEMRIGFCRVIQKAMEACHA
jgi:hypothetical protein